MTVSLRLSEEDARLIKSYAKFNNITISEFLRKSAIERIEDEYDLETYKKAMKEYQDDPVSYSLDEIERELGL